MQGNSSGDVSAVSLRRRIVCSLVLLEAFGNASDPNNSNSSRFVSFLPKPNQRFVGVLLISLISQGCFYDIEIDFKGDPISAHVNCCKLH